jgi:hypothetical protein
MHHTISRDIYFTQVKINGHLIKHRSNTGRLGIKAKSKHGGRCTFKVKGRNRYENIKASIVIAAYNTIS